MFFIDLEAYSEYPAFQGEAQGIVARYYRAAEALYQRCLQERKAAGPEVWEVFQQELAPLRAQSDQELAVARQRHHVPTLQAWDTALSETGVARYHDVASLRENITVTATMQEQGGLVTLDVHILHCMPRERAFGPHGYTSVRFPGLAYPTWEAVQPEQAAHEEQPA